MRTVVGEKVECRVKDGKGKWHVGIIVESDDHNYVIEDGNGVREPFRKVTNDIRLLYAPEVDVRNLEVFYTNGKGYEGEYSSSMIGALSLGIIEAITENEYTPPKKKVAEVKKVLATRKYVVGKLFTLIDEGVAKC